ncbi:PEP/pyruvate-binding domain-containing protein [Actinoplanes couchii]|uniref:Pyruvate, phosphate dikinase n=1 Tax=Actinoplanes couchii TaxID=403638 RepID=A0ABQ3XGQ8_9ACTN|nr:PEP/pyruvate-binding domain-containing protein [Actinoplanes couchii]MDR6320855.1 pyruvate,orthophosphate dikinase [Actinoplanes couchii]GID57661.1 hypothetical protein Aco03nite_060650 [Actinoplanes couchii]
MRFIHPLTPTTPPPDPDLVGAKAHGLFTLLNLGFPVPSGFVISTEACRTFLHDGRFPEDLSSELSEALSDLAASAPDRHETGQPYRGAGQPPTVDGPLLVSVRSGAAVSMPGMMNTLLNVVSTALTDLAPPPHAAPSFERASPKVATRGSDKADITDAVSFAETSDSETPDLETSDLADAAGTNAAAGKGDSAVRSAVEAVFSSWNTARAVTYRELHDISHDLGTAVIVQAMVFGDRDRHSGSGVAFSRDPSTGERVVYGDVLFGHQGEDVVSGRFPTRPLIDLAGRESLVWAELVGALELLERHFRDVCHVEFTYESGRLWLLQVRPGGLSGRAAVRAAVEMADEGLIDRRTALNRVTPRQLKAAHTPRIRLDGTVDVVARGVGASPGVATGRIAVTADQAARMAAHGPVILARPHTSPLDMHGLAAAAGIVTTVGGPTSHAAVVARSMGKPSVVSAAAIEVDTTAGCVRTSGRVLTEGTVITIDGLGGEVVLGSPEITTGDTDPHLARLLTWAEEAIDKGTT